MAISPFESIYRGCIRGAGHGNDGFNSFRKNLTEFVQAHKIWLVAALFMVLIPAALIIKLRGDIDVGTPSDNLHTRDAVIAALLAGERLTPPPALPPESFTTVEVMTIRPSLANASRDWTMLDDNFSQRLLRVYQRMREQGYEMVLLEGYRSPERQNQLAAMGNHVTNAVAFQSYHQYGMAADTAFLRDGKVVISEKDPWAMRGYELYGQEAEAMGLTWGGRWKMMDFGHVELRGAKRLPASPATSTS